MKKSKTGWLVLGAALSVLALAAFCYLTWCYLDWRSVNELAARLREQTSFYPAAELTPSEEPSPVLEPSPAASPSAEPIEIPVDFAALREINPDIYAWIRIPGTGVDGPILRSAGSEEYYMTHSADGEYSAYGALFTQSYNGLDFTDFNTVIYGHRTGAMFGELLWFSDNEYFDEHNIIYIYTPQKILTYRVFAAYTYGVAHILDSFDFSDEYTRGVYIKSIFNVRDMAARIDSGAAVGTDDRILTLSTCTQNLWTSRFLVQGVLIEETG